MKVSELKQEQLKCVCGDSDLRIVSIAINHKCDNGQIVQSLVNEEGVSSHEGDTFIDNNITICLECKCEVVKVINLNQIDGVKLTNYNMEIPKTEVLQ